MKKIKYWILIFLMPAMVLGQSKTETIKKSFELANPTQEFWFGVCNIEGDVSVEAYNGKTIEVEVNKKISARSEADLAVGMEDIKVDFTQGDGFIMARMISSQNRYRVKNDPLACGWDWERNGNYKRVEYKQRLDFTVKVPKGISVKISTVNNGNLYLEGVAGEVYANNVNGNVDLIGLSANAIAQTVNGHVEVSYVQLPKEFGEFETVNGDIILSIPNNANGVFDFETQWGKIYSDFDFSGKVSPKLVANKTKSGGTNYKIDSSNSYQLGEGGPSYQFKTLNGNIKVIKSK